MPDDELPATEAIRFTYELDEEGAFVLIDAVEVSMTTLGSDELDPELAPFAGFWYELRDVDGGVLWRHVTQHPLRATVEVHDDDGSMGRLDDDDPDPVATVVVPALDGADVVALMGSPTVELDTEVVELLVHDFVGSVA